MTNARQHPREVIRAAAGRHARLALTLTLLLCAVAAAARAADHGGPIVRVTGATPYPEECGTSPYPDSEVEFSLAVDSSHPRRLVGSWIQDAPRAPAVAYSRDGGREWRVALPPKLAACTGSEYVRSTDPWLSVAPEGVSYLVTLPISPSGTAPAIQVSRSGDTGRTWSDPVFVERRTEASEPDDKPTIAADPFASGKVYVTWSRRRVQSTSESTSVFNQIDFSRSTNGGRAWSQATTVDTPPSGWTDALAQILVPRRGQLLCVFSRRELADDQLFPLVGGHVRFYATRSKDRGRTWSRPVLIGRGENRSLQDTETATPIRSGATHVFGASSGTDGRVYFAWTQVGSDDQSRILLARSDDAGRSWSNARRVSGGAVRPMNPDLAVADNGMVALRFYDLREDQPGDEPLSTRSWIRLSKNGKRFGGERPLGGIFDLRAAPVASGLTPGRFLGEYQGLVGLPTGFAALFAQAEPEAQVGSTDGFFKRVGFGR
jgi:hypothetical protein